MPPIPRSFRAGGGGNDAVSIAEELVRAAQGMSPIPDLATEESLRAALHNFLANNIQNRTIPLATQSIQDAIDDLGMSVFMQANEVNPRFIDLVFGSGRLNETPNPIEEVIRSGGYTEPRSEDFGSFNDIGELLGSNRSSLDELGPEEIQQVQRVLAEAQDRVRGARQNPEITEMIPDMQQITKNIPGAEYVDILSRLESGLGALQFNNNFRAVGPMAGGRSVQTPFAREGADPAKVPLIQAVESLEQAGVPIPVIYGHLLDVLRQMDTWIRAGMHSGGAEGGTYTNLIDPEAVARQHAHQEPGPWQDFGWPPGTEAWAAGEPIQPQAGGDPTTILRALGLDRR